MIISISGKSGSGKSTVAMELAERLQYSYVSVGQQRRKLAEEKGLDINQFNELSKEKKEFDTEVDKAQENLNPSENIILDSRLGFYFQPDSFKVFLDVSPEASARRLVSDDRESEKYEDLESAKEKIKERNKNDKERYLSLYGVNPFLENNYDLVILTDNLSVNEVVKKILEKLNERDYY